MRGSVGAVAVLIGALCMVAPARAAETSGSEACLACHTSSTPGVVSLWQSSKHFGAKVG
jgi:hypothetical protein